MAQQSLYRRYRPKRFGEIRGQDHIMRTLRNAVATGTEGHAYMFSGPRGTGKTSTARILAKALNCDDLLDGEPCCKCEPCLAMEAGRSFDLFELDAASNNGVDSIRDLVERAVVSSPGRTKVYILDEVHMLSKGAANALLKTLEEPPDHVRFVLATTDPHKVLPTIRSRTQHFEFNLISADELEQYVRWIVADAGLDVDDTAITHVVRQGRGSARDTLSALDQVVAAGGVAVRAEPLDQLFSALIDSDSGAAVLAVEEALTQGHDPRVLGEEFLAAVRDTFLVSLGVEVPHLLDADAGQFAEWSAALGTARLTKAMESIGAALIDMRQAADPRVPLEVALVRLTTSGSPEPPRSAPPEPAPEVPDIVKRLERLEAAVATSTASTASAGNSRRGPGKAPAPPMPPRAPQATPGATRSGARAPAAAPPRRALSSSAARGDASSTAAESSTTVDSTAPTSLPDRDALVMAFSDVVVPKLKGVQRALFTNGRFVSVTSGAAVFAVENKPTLERAEKYRSGIEQMLADHFGTPVPLHLIVEQEADHPKDLQPGSPAFADGTSVAPGEMGSRPSIPQRSPGQSDSPTSQPTDASEADGSVGTPGNAAANEGNRMSDVASVSDEESMEVIDVNELENADVATTGVERLTAAFPGAELIQTDEGAE